LKSSPNVTCWGKQHLLWVLTIGLPGILLWGFVAPCLIFFGLYKFRFQIQTIIRENQEQQNLKIKKNKTVTVQRISLDIEPWIKAKVLKGVKLPLKFEFNYKNQNEILKEMIEINEKSHFEILEISSESSNSHDFFIKDPKILFKYLKLDEKLAENIINEKDLEEHLAFVRYNYQIENLKQDKKTRKNLIFFSDLPPKEHKIYFAEKKSTIFRSLGFIYKGFKPNFYFWEIVLFSRKMILIFLGVFTEFSQKSSRDINLIFVLMVYFYFQLRYKPYQMKFFNRIETFSLLTATFSAYIGIALYSETMKKASIFFLVLLFGMNLNYLVMWFYYFVKFSNIGEVLRRKACSMTKCVEKLDLIGKFIFKKI